MDTSKSAHKLLEGIRKRPAMYFGNTELRFTSLLGFIGGYQVGYAAAQNDSMPQHLIPDDFHRFVTEYFGQTFPAGGKGWSTFVSEQTKSEQEAFEMFFRLLDEYEKRHTNAA